MDNAKFRLFQKNYGVCQVIPEWQVLFEFLESYFRNRGIERPVVVELGTERNNQKFFFREFLNAKHIGIDRSDRHGKPDIVGDAFSPETLKEVNDRLEGKPINLLMAELDTGYKEAKLSWEVYGPMTENIVCFHSVETLNSGVWKFWQELYNQRDEYLKITIFNQHPEGHELYKVRMGKGLVVKIWK